MKDFARKGYFGFQDHGLPVWYRNIRIKKLVPKGCKIGVGSKATRVL